ncbi:pyrimidine 5'-nucleotidase [Mangrovibrevibacter kandeliae]|uniref:pyrimidine 5'-nucleotidase n=1 Tax=Mangrovibrevibacter kandeliae TaxID=2968473 RepID=UPI002117AA9E|nr:MULTISPECIES: pyrimidine 5'-nucleotidase [unclassified Aurantimonas]MCQ8783449.1 pyrimidine 5'-nucleotidase [Aurantimonas sp. CSK15Z-1]MCW4116035.1 pyrimidine 5'-nucleotidase [Aurantimonas sp. MSK8Z-1]
MTVSASILQTADATAEGFAHVRDWVFDLDNTLYPRHSNLFSQIDERMTLFVSQFLQLDAEEARALQKRLYREHGTTLRGLMREHAVDPDTFLQFVHDIDYTWIAPDLALGEEVRALPGRKFIFTNGDRRHAERAARQLGILNHFEDIFDIVAADLLPKPAAETYDKFMGLHRIDASRAAMFEDLARNLEVPKRLGMRTVLVVPRNLETTFGDAWEHEGRDGEHIDYITDDLATFLRRVRPA